MSLTTETMPVPQIGLVQNVQDQIGLRIAFIKDGFDSLRDRLDGCGQKIAAVALVASVGLTACSGGGESSTGIDGQPVGGVSTDLLRVLNPQNVETHCATLADKFALETFDRGDGTRGVSPRLEFQAPVGEGDDHRISSDAMGTRFANRDPFLSDREKAAVNCADPLQGVATLSFLANLEVGGQKVGDLNARLKKFQVEPDEIDDLAAEYMPLLGSENRDPNSITTEEVDYALAKQREYQSIADMGSQVLAGFQPAGIVRSSATGSLHLANKGMKTGAKGLPVVEAVNEADGMFVRLNLTDKGEECPEVSIGLNVGVNGQINGGDKRPAMLPNQCEEAPEPTAAPEETAPEDTAPPRTVVTVGATTTTFRLPDGTTTTIQNRGTTTTQAPPTTQRPNPTTTQAPPTTQRPNPTTTQAPPTTQRPNPTTTQAPPTTVRDRVKDHTESPVVSDPNAPDERVRPNVPVEPVRPVPAIPDEVQPDRGDSGTGAINTVPAPVDEVPANNTTPEGPVNQPRPDGQPTPAR